MESVVRAAPRPEAQAGPPAGSPAQAALGQGVPAPPPPRGALVLLRTAASPPGHRQLLAEPPAGAGTSPGGAAGSALPSALRAALDPHKKQFVCFFLSVVYFQAPKGILQRTDRKNTNRKAVLTR